MSYTTEKNNSADRGLMIPSSYTSNASAPFDKSIIHDTLKYIEEEKKNMFLRLSTFDGFSYNEKNIPSSADELNMKDILNNAMNADNDSDIDPVIIPLGYVLISHKIGSIPTMADVRFDARTNTKGFRKLLHVTSCKPTETEDWKFKNKTLKKDEEEDDDSVDIYKLVSSNGVFVSKYAILKAKDEKGAYEKIKELLLFLLDESNTKGVNPDDYVESNELREISYCVKVPSIEINFDKAPRKNSLDRLLFIYNQIKQHIKNLSSHYIKIRVNKKTPKGVPLSYIYTLVKSSDNVKYEPNITIDDTFIPFKINESLYWSRFLGHGMLSHSDKFDIMTDFVKKAGLEGHFEEYRPVRAEPEPETPKRTETKKQPIGPMFAAQKAKQHEHNDNSSSSPMAHQRGRGRGGGRVRYYD